MTSAQQQALLRGANCEIAFDDLTRSLFSRDASIYEIQPVAVAFPRSARQVCVLVDAAMQAGINVIARGAGTGLVGGAIGEGLIIDFSRYMRRISNLDLERRAVHVQPGVILDQLNQFLRPHGLCFGPDVATSSRATLGGMIANNSSGSHTPFYGTTSDHVRELELVLADSRLVSVGSRHDTLPRQRELVATLMSFHSLEIAERMPPGLLKRRPGYALDEAVRDPENLNHLLCGSEGTLGLITSAELDVVPLPEERGLGLVFFASIAEALESMVSLLDLEPAAIEHLDRVLLDQTRNQLEFQKARDLLQLDFHPCQSILAVEFLENVGDKLAALSKRRLGLRTLILSSKTEASLVWSLRKAGLSLLTGRKGPAKPVTCVEDAAVLPSDLPEYFAALDSVIAGMGLEASYYGHAAAGLLHVRPVLDLHSPADIRKMREVATEVSRIVKQFKGSLAGEHGVGIARTEFMLEQVGETLLGVMAEIKNSFDPHNLLNPGKIIPDGRYELDSDLRLGPGSDLALAFEPVLAFADKDESFIGNLEQCNGCGGCRKETPSMCPTFMATGKEALSTRGRANGIRTLLESVHAGNHAGSALLSADLEYLLGTCLSCKACTTECPSNVNLSLLKAELANARIAQRGLTLRERLFATVDQWSRAGAIAPRLANLVLQSPVALMGLSRMLGLAPERTPPAFAAQTFTTWFARHSRPASAGSRGAVLLWDDTFVRYYEPQVGIAAVRVLESAGYEVRLLHERKCCGRPAFSQGYLKRVLRLAAHNVELVNAQPPNAPVLFLEPSCYSMFAQDYRELKIPGADRAAARCFLFEQFVHGLLVEEPGALSFVGRGGKVLIHAHCHVKSSMDTGFLKQLAARIPQREAVLLDSGCCGMAGGFGASAEKYELSVKVAEPLVENIRAQPFGTVVVASGTSCRQQINHLTTTRARHMAELLADALARVEERGA